MNCARLIVVTLKKNNDYMLYPILTIVHVVALRIDMGLATILYTQYWD